MWFGIQVTICKAWCKLTGGHAVYVKDLNDNSISVRVMRIKFDPFVDVHEKVVYMPKFGYRKCHANGRVGNSDAWIWRYVNEEAHVAHRLSN
jgi:hypothetical protein